MTLLTPGSRLGPYEVGELLGRGGMSVVYKGYDATLDRPAALKVLPAEFLHDVSFVDRLKQEAQLWGRLDHPAIVPVYYSGVEGDHPFIAMKFVGGGPLSALIGQGPVPLERSLSILKAVAGALDYAHDAGIVHRDVKPANVLLGADGSAYLTDFGIARALAESRGATGGSGIVGTPGYMAPEQARSPRPDPRSDVYSLGCLAYEMLTGKAPFQGDTPMDVMLRHILEAPTPPRALVPALSHAIEKAVLTAMAKDPTKRWPRAGMFVQALDAAAASEGLDTISLSDLPRVPGLHQGVPSPGRLVAVAAVSAVIAFGGVAMARRMLIPPPPKPSALPGTFVKDMLAASNRAMDEGAYPEALRIAEAAASLVPENPDVRRQRERVRSAWKAEQELRLWSPSPSPAPVMLEPQPSGVDVPDERH
jgi:serine/threonine protein kinase